MPHPKASNIDTETPRRPKRDGKGIKVGRNTPPRQAAQLDRASSGKDLGEAYDRAAAIRMMQ